MDVVTDRNILNLVGVIKRRGSVAIYINIVLCTVLSIVFGGYLRSGIGEAFPWLEVGATCSRCADAETTGFGLIFASELLIAVVTFVLTLLLTRLAYFSALSSSGAVMRYPDRDVLLINERLAHVHRMMMSCSLRSERVMYFPSVGMALANGVLVSLVYLHFIL